MEENRLERRRGPDPLARSLRWIAAAGWAVLCAALLVLDRAKPEVETFFERYYKISLRSTWDMELARVLFYLMLAGLCLSLGGLALNALRHRRAEDEWRLNLVVIALISLGGILGYLFWL